MGISYHSMSTSKIGKSIVNWYREHQRDLPWRRQAGSYAVWVSEIMLQQTRVETVVPYFNRWMERFPTIEDLAAASQQEVLAVWEGMGYYSRARNLHKAAQVMVGDFSGALPGNIKDLRDLPGIGPYTAGAIASIVFGLDEAAVDGNVKRVLARIFNVEETIGTSAGEQHILDLAEEHIPPGQASDYNQGLMELGARLCTPKNPNCEDCPVKEECLAYDLGIQEDRPVRKSKRAIPVHTLVAAVIREGNYILLRQRAEDGLLGGMWEFPNVRVHAGEDEMTNLEECVREDLGLEVEVGKQLGAYQQTYTHFRVCLTVFRCVLSPVGGQVRERRTTRWVRLAKIYDYPMGKLDRQISRQLYTQAN